MFKLKMSLLLKSLKFKVTVAAVILAAIVFGIILMPKNRADNISQQVNIKANPTGVTVGGRDLYYIEKDGQATGYNKLLCIQEEANLNYKTYSNPTNITNAKSYFTFYNSAMWLINNMYLTNVTGSNMDAATARQISIVNLANILTSNTVKEAVQKQTGVDYSSVTPQKIINLKDKKIGGTYSKNAIETVEQIALWNYTKNAGTTISSAYKNNPNTYLTGASLSADEQKTLKYVYYAIINVANKKGNTAEPTTTSNQITLNKNNVKYDANSKLVGPYYIQSNGFNVTSYSFGNLKDGGYPITIIITNADGKEVKADNKITKINKDGSFYIDLSNYPDARKVSFQINSVLSGVTTTAYALDGGDKQNLLAVEKNIKAQQLIDTQEITIPGSYTIELKKVKNDGTTVITASEAKFNVNGKSYSTQNGILNVSDNKKISNEKQIDTYEIVEEEAPQGFEKFEGKLKLSVGFVLQGNKYIIDKNKTTSEGFDKGTKMEISEDCSKITIYVPNNEKPGQYSVELYKVNTKGELINTPAKFDVNGNEAITKSGKIQIASNITVDDENKVNTYTIKEVESPENYYLFNGTITLNVKMSKTDKGFVLNKEDVSLKTDKESEKVNFTLDGSTIKVYVINELKPFDLALRQYISKINGVVVEPSREPIINEQSIIMLQKTGTASYYHTKNSISVSVGDEIEYTIRVYNEGEILGYAKEITDYLPEGLSFVRIADESSNQYTTNSQVGSKVVVLNYNGNTLIKSLRDFIGKKVNVTNEYYQEVKIICKVENTDKVYITNRGEITNYGYNVKDENGNTVWKEAKEIGNVDVDSVENTIKNELDLDAWYEKAQENTYKDEKGNIIVDKNYYPGTQDDDDFETVELLAGKYNIIIKKVDSADKTKTLQGASFAVSGSNIENELTVGPTSTNGQVVVVKGVKIANEKQTDTYTIKETIAPNDYKLYDGTVNVTVKTKLENNNLVVDKKNTTVEGKNVEFSVNEDNTEITITILNTKKSFDLSLRKFITDVNGKELAENRAPQVDVSKLVKGEAKTAIYNHSKTPVDVNTTDIVTYTIRVYNEGETDGYASKIMDDIPEGLEFIPASFDNEGKATNVNAEYKWKLYKEVEEGASAKDVISYNGKVYALTDDAKSADLIVTDYLSKENGTNNLLKAFDSKTMKTLDYKDVKVSFKVVEPTTSDRIITNYAQITEHTNPEGKTIVTDRDSTPNEWIDGEDDQDTEKIKVRYFDLSLLKWVSKAIVYENGVEKVTETGHTGYENPEPIVKVDLKNTNINNVVVKFEYKIKITNEGEIAGYAKEVSDYIPEGLKFEKADNPQWEEKDGKIVTRSLENVLLQPGENAEVTVILTWINGDNNLGLKTNIAEISEDYNEYGTPDIDSTPNNKVPGEDDIDDAPVILAVRTGEPIVYAGIAAGILAIIASGVILIKRKVILK